MSGATDLMHPVLFVGGPAGDGMTMRVMGFKKYRRLVEDTPDGRRVYRYRRVRKNGRKEYHLDSIEIVSQN